MANYGDIAYGTFFYGDNTAPVGTFERGYVPNAKQDTYYLGKSNGDTSGNSFADFTTDHSQFGLSGWSTAGGHPKLTAGSDTPFDVNHPREITVVFDADNTNQGFIFVADDATNEFGFLLVAGEIQPIVNGASDNNGNLTLPGISGTTENFVVSWVTDHSRDSGESAARSWIFAYNTTDGSFAQVTWTHASTASVNADLHLWGHDGSQIFDGTAYCLRLGNRFHTATEMVEDFIAQSDPPSYTGETRVEPPVPDRSSGFGDVAELVGPTESTVANALHLADLRQASPLVNEYFTDAKTDYDRNFNPSPWKRLLPSNTDYTIMGQFFWWAPVPRSCNGWKARVCLTHAGTTDDITVMVLNFNKIPTVNINQLANNNLPDPNYEERYVTEAKTVGSSTTEWLDFSDATREILRDSKGGTYFAIAISGIHASTTFGIQAITIDPILDQTTNGVIGSGTLKP